MVSQGRVIRVEGEEIQGTAGVGDGPEVTGRLARKKRKGTSSRAAHIEGEALFAPWC